MRNYKHIIAEIFVFRNGMVAVLDQNGKQMPFFQGLQKEVMRKLKARLDRQKTPIIWKVQESANFDLPKEVTVC